MKGNVIRFYYCSFCNKSQELVRWIVAGPEGICICNECIKVCQEIMEEKCKEIEKPPESEETEGLGD